MMRLQWREDWEHLRVGVMSVGCRTGKRVHQNISRQQPNPGMLGTFTSVLKATELVEGFALGFLLGKKELVPYNVQYHSLSSKEVRTEAQGRILEARDEVEAMEGCCCLLACSGWLLTGLSYSFQDYRPRGGTAHSDPHQPTPTIN